MVREKELCTKPGSFDPGHLVVTYLEEMIDLCLCETGQFIDRLQKIEKRAQDGCEASLTLSLVSPNASTMKRKWHAFEAGGTANSVRGIFELQFK